MASRNGLRCVDRWARRWFGARPPRRRPGARLCLESLEDRLTPAAISWDGGGGNFDWNNALNWSSDTLPGATDDVTIDVPAAAITVVHGSSSGSTTINSLVTAEALDLTGGTLTVVNGMTIRNTFSLAGGTLRNTTVSTDNAATMQVTQGTSVPATLDGVTLGVKTTLRGGTAGSGNQVKVLNGLTLDNVTLRLERTSTFNTTNGDPRFDVGLNFAGGAQRLGGVGVVELFHALDPGGDPLDRNVRIRPSASGSLTIGAGITVRNAPGSDLVVLGDASLPLAIEGTIAAQVSGRTFRVNGLSGTSTGTLTATAGTLEVNNLTGDVGSISVSGGSLTLAGTYRLTQPVNVTSGALTLNGTWDNESTIAQAGGKINLGGVFQVDDLGAFTGTAGTVNVSGILNDPGATLNLDATRTWQLDGGTIRGVTLDDPVGSFAPFQATANDGTLDGVTLRVNTTLLDGAQVTVTNSLTLADNVLLKLNRSDFNTEAFELDVRLNFSGGAQTLGGTGVVELHNAFAGNQGGFPTDDNVRIRPTGAGSSLTIGAGVTVRTTTNSQRISLGDPLLPLIIEGTLLARSGQTFRINGSTVTNTGTLRATAGTLDLAATTFSNNGTLTASASTILVQAATLSNLVAGTLTGGTWEAVANGDIYLPNTVTTNAANLVLDGSGANFYLGNSGTTDALGSLRSNTSAGSLTISGGRILMPPLDFTNGGDLTIGAGSRFGNPTTNAPTSSGLISHWRADGDANDSVGTNHGSLVNGADSTNPGISGQTYSLDGVDDHVRFDDAASLRPTNLTIAAWVNFSALPTGSNVAFLVGKPVGTGNENSFGLWYNSSSGGALRAYVSNNVSGAPVLSSSWNPGVGLWHHVAFTFDNPSDTMRLYIDGVQVVSSTSASRSIVYDSNPVLIGADVNSGAFVFPFDGRIDEVRLYNRALTSAEVQGVFGYELGPRAFTHTGGTLTLAGTLVVSDYTGDSGATLAFSLNSPYAVAGTDFGQLVVNGAVDLRGAALDLSGGAVLPGRRSVMTLISNDAGDAVSGTFNNLTDDEYFTLANLSLVGRYAGGSGNDVVLVTTGLTATENAGNLTIADAYTTGEANQLTLSRVGDTLQIRDAVEMFGAIPAGATLSADRQTLTIPLAGLTSLTINGGGGNDVLTVDLSNGNPIPAAGLVFNGGDPTSGVGDALVILGGAQGTVTYNHVNTSDGSVVMSNFGTITYTGLEPITNTGSATDIIFNLPAVANAATLGDDGIVGNGLSRLSGTTFETTDFANPSNSLTINRGNAADTLTVAALPDFNATLTLGSAAAPFATTSFTGAVSLTAGNDLTVAATAVNVTAGGNLALPGGDVAVVAADVSLAGPLNADSVSIVPPAGRAVDVGTNTTGQLSLTDAELDQISAAVVQLGDNTSGSITISAAISPANYQTLRLGNAVNFAATGGFVADVASATVYEGMQVAGALTIHASAALTVTAVGGFVPTLTDRFTLIENTSAATTSGTFAGKPERAKLSVGGPTKVLSYSDGTGNDIGLLPGTLTAVLDNGNLTIAEVGPPGPENRLTVSVSGANLVFSELAEPFVAVPAGSSLSLDLRTLTVPRSAVTGTLTIDLVGGGDTLTVDLSGGNPIPAGGLVFNGGAGVGDALVFVGGAQGTVTYNPSSASAGTVQLSNFGTVAYTGLESLSNTGSATDSVFNLPAGPNSATLADDGTASNGLSRLSAATFVTTNFAAPTSALTINRGHAADALSIASVPDFGANLTLGSAANPLDAVSFRGGLTLAANNHLAVWADTIAVVSPAAIAVSGTGSVSLTAAEGVAIAGSVTTVGGNLAVDADSDDDGSGTFTVSAAVLAGWSQSAQVTADDGAAGDRFGYRVAVDGDTAVVGAYADDGERGSAYVFTRSGATWTQQAKLVAADGAAGDRFGISVAIDGGTVVVGSYLDDEGAANQGSAYVFTGSGASWTLQQKLTAFDAAANDFFGETVAISGDTILVSAYLDDGTVSNQGSAYVFTRSGVTWSFQQKLTASDAASNDNFGSSLAIDGNTVIVGAYQDNVSFSDQGSAYIFVRSGTTWTEQQKLTVADGEANLNMGLGVAISGNTVVVGAPGADRFNPFDSLTRIDQGAAYVFTRSGVTWTQQQKLSPSEGATFDAFGSVVAIDGDLIVVGARSDDVNANPDEGSAYVFRRSGSTWTQQSKLTTAQGAAGDSVGVGVAVQGDTILVGADADDVSGANQGSFAVFAPTAASGAGSIATGGGAVIFDAADLDLDSVVNAGGGLVRIVPSGVGRAVDLGANTTGQLGLTEAELDRITAGTLAIGAADSGTITVSNALTRAAATHLVLTSGADVTVVRGLDTAGGTAALTARGSVTLAGAVTTGGGTFTANADSDADGTGTFTVSAAVLASWPQVAKLSAGVSDVGGDEGPVVALDGDTAVVGNEGVNGGTGVAQVFVRSGATWVHQATLIASDAAAGDNFGHDVDISGDTIVVSALGDDRDGFTTAGSAYVFTRSGTTWTEQTKLFNSGSTYFGNSAAIDGDTILIGATEEGNFATPGSVYVYRGGGATWTQEARLTASDSSNHGMRFGVALDIDGDTVVASYSTGGPNPESGAAYVWVRSGTTWTEQARLTSGDTDDGFGWDVAVSGHTVVVGALEGGAEQGLAHVFVRDDATWTQQAVLSAIGGGQFRDQFGDSVAINGDTIVVGAVGDNATFTDQGSAYVFRRSGTTWTPQQMLTASDASFQGQFAETVAVDGDTVLVGGKAAQAAYFFTEAAVASSGGSVTTGSATASVTAADLVLNGTVNAGTGTVALAPSTAGRTIDLGGNPTGQLGLSDTELDRVTAGTLRIGSATAGAITVTAGATRAATTAVVLSSGGDIAFTNGVLNTAGGNATLATGATGSVTVAQVGTDVNVGATGLLAFAPGLTLSFAVNGTTVDTQYHQLNVVGRVDLTGVNLVLTGTYSAVAIDTFILIANDGTDAPLGTFNGLPEGALVFVNGVEKRLTYVGGDGNDVAIGPTGTLAATVSGGNLIVDDIFPSGKANRLTLRLVGDNLVFTDDTELVAGPIPVGSTRSDGNRTLTIPVSAVTGSLTINLLGGRDTLTVDLSGGNPIPAGGLTFNGGNPTTGTGDALVIVGSSQGVVTYNYTNAGDGSVVMSNFGTITYTGLEQLTNTGTATDIVFNLPAGPNAATLGDDGTAGNGLSRLSGTTFETTDFANPTGSLIVNRGHAADTIAVNALPDFTAALGIGSAASPVGAVDLAGAVTLAAHRSLSAFAGSIRVATTGAVTTSGSGGVSLTASNGVTVSGAVTTGSGSIAVDADSDDDGVGTFTVSAAVMAGWSQQARLIASDGAANDSFSQHTIAISGDTAVVAAYQDDIGANVDQGSVYVFERSGTTWVQQAKLIASDGAAGDQFGSYVGIDGNTIVVGAYLDDVGAIVNQGSAYVFTRSGTTWTEQQRLTASDGAADDRFGGSVAIDGSTIVVGAYLESTGSRTAQGAAYVFVSNGTTWTQEAKLLASDRGSGDLLGVSIAISGNTVLVGAPFDNATFADQGSAYVFVRSGTTWTEQAKLTAGDGGADDRFGQAVAIDGDTIVVGVHLDDIGSNADQGSAYVFTRSGTTWTQQQKLTSSDGAAGDQFGVRVTVSGNTVAAGAYLDDIGSNADQGSAYVFTRSGTTWTQQQKLTASDGAAGDRFGAYAGIDGNTVVVAADLDVVGANANAGSVYVFSFAAEASSAGVFETDGGMVAVTAAEVVGGGSINASAGTIALNPSAGQAINLGTTTPGQLSLTDAELDLFSAAVVQVGDAGSGAITISAALSPASYRVLRLGNDTSFAATGGFAADVASASNYERIEVDGALTIHPSATLTVTGVGGFVPDDAAAFTLIDNLSGDSTSGTFAGLPQYATVTVGGERKTLSYAAGTGNDVVLLPYGTLTATSVGGKLTIADVHPTGQGNQLTIRRVGDDLVITDVAEPFFGIAPGDPSLSDGRRTLTIPLSSIGGSLTINLAGGNDSLTVDLRSGNPIPSGGLIFNGGNPTSGVGDTLVIVGGAQGTVTYNYTNASDGSVVMSNFGTITYTGLEPITNTGTATDIIFNLPAVANAATLGDDGISSNGLSRLSGATFETTDFTSPTNSLTINRGSAADTITVTLLPDFDATLNIGSPPSPFGLVDVLSAVALAAGHDLTIAAGTIRTGADLTLVGGNVTLTATTGITLGGGVTTGGGRFTADADSDDDGVGTFTLPAPTLEQWSQQSILSAADGGTSDRFGFSVALDGNTAVMGAFFDDVGTNSNQGSVYVFTRSGATWTQQAKLVASDGAANDRFGSSVSLLGDTLVVGAPLDDIGANADQGSAYVFTRTLTTWTERAKLLADNGAATDEFGESVAINGNTVVVGAPSDTNASGIDRGSAYVFTGSGATWTQETNVLNPSVGRVGFSASVALSGDTMVLGHTTSGNNPVYVYTRTGTTWTQQAQIDMSDPSPSGQDSFGAALALSGDTLVVGANSDAIGANTTQGSVYVYTRSGTTWSLQTKLTASDGMAGDHFGDSVSLSGDRMVIGAGNEDAGVPDSGAVYVFTRSGATWTQLVKLRISSPRANDVFGTAVAISGETVLVGAPGDEVGATSDTGSAVVFTVTSPAIIGGAIATSNGPVSITAADVLVSGAIDAGTGTVGIVQSTPGRAINVGNDVAGELGLTDSELDFITADVVRIGDAASGAISISSHISPANYPTLRLGRAASFAETGGFFSDVTSATVYERIEVEGALLIAAGAFLHAIALGGFVPADADAFALIANLSGEATSGTFFDLPQYATVTVGGERKTLSYVADTGNDVVLLPYGTLTATSVGGSLTVADIHPTGQGNQLTIQRLGDDLVITDAAEPFFGIAPGDPSLSDGRRTLTIPLSSISGGLTVNLAGGNDTLTVDLRGGNPIPAGGLVFNGGDPTTSTGDALVIVGGAQGTVTYNYTNASDGSVVMANFGTITYTGLEPITNTGSATDIIFNLPAGADNAVLEDDGAVGNGLMRLRSASASFETTTFAVPTGSLTLNAGGGNDTITVAGVDALYNAALSLNGDAGTDTMSLNADITFAADQSLVVTAETVDVGAGADLVTSGSGQITLTGDTMALAATATLVSPGTVTLVTQTAGRAISLGTEVGTSLSLTDAELDRITAGLVQLGTASSGTITIAAALSHGNNLALTTGGGITFSQAVTLAANRSLTATSTSTTAGVSFSTTTADLTASGTGAVSITATRNIALTAGASITTASGDIFLSANQQATPTTGSFVGIDITTATVGSTTGNITLLGRGGDGAAGAQEGVRVLSGGTVTGGTAGTLTLTGTGGNSSGVGNRGVRVNGTGSTVTSNGANVVVSGTGQGSAGGSSNNVGVEVSGGGRILAGGSGSVSVTGQGAMPVVGAFVGPLFGFGGNDGVLVTGGNSTITSSGGDVSVFGIGGTSATQSHQTFGVDVLLSGLITAGGTGAVNVQGIGGRAPQVSNSGIRVEGVGSAIRSSGGNLTLHGTGSDSGTSNNGVFVGNSATVAAGGVGAVSILGEGGIFGPGVAIVFDAIVTSASNVVVEGTSTTSHGIFLNSGTVSASGSGNVTLIGQSPESEPSRRGFFAANASNVFATGGTITVSADSQFIASTASITAAVVTLRQKTAGVRLSLGGADVVAGPSKTLGLTDDELDTITASVVEIGDTSSGTISITAPISPANYQTLRLGKDASFSATGGFASDITSATVHEKLEVAGILSISATATLNVTAVGGFVPAASDEFTVIENTSAGATVGAFAGKPESANVLIGGVNKSITYVGGTGNDVVLQAVEPASLVVTTELDVVANDSLTSLREAMNYANVKPGLDTISFNIPGTGVKTIRVGSSGLGRLPTITEAVILDAATQPGYAGAPLVEIDGSSAGSDGLVVVADNATIRGLIINRFAGQGISLFSSFNVLEGNYIGTDATGTVDLGNGDNGILIEGGNDNRIGGPLVEQRNVISGNEGHGIRVAGVSTSSTSSSSSSSGSGGGGGGSGGGLFAATGNLILGNFIGTNAAGSAGLGNAGSGVVLDFAATDNRIGGSDAGEGNVIANNGSAGVVLSGPDTFDNVVNGNWIGTDVTGTLDLGNTDSGIVLANGTTNNTIGGNFIAFNGDAGIVVLGEDTTFNSFRGNRSYANAGLGIDLGGDGVSANDSADSDTGPNARQNYPVVTVVDSPTPLGITKISVTLHGSPFTEYVVELFVSPLADATGFGEGQDILSVQHVFTDETGNASFTANISPAVDLLETGVVTATATDPDGNTSEFSLARASGTLNPTLDGGALTIADVSLNGRDNQLTIRREGDHLVITDNRELFPLVPAGAALSADRRSLFIPLSSVTSLTLDLAGGSDTVTVELSEGNPIPSGGLSFLGGNGGEGVALDLLRIVGGDQGVVRYDYLNAHDGSVAMSNFGLINYTGLEPIINSGIVTDIIFNLPAGPNAATLGDDGMAGNGMSRLSGGTFETTDFTNPTNSLTINRGDAADALTVNALPDLAAALTIGSAASPFGASRFTGTVTLAAGNSLSVSADSVDVQAGSALTVSGGASATVVATTVDLAGTLDAGTGTVTVQGPAGLAINVGTETAGQLSLTDAELDRITAGVVQIGDADSGAITITAEISPANYGTLRLGNSASFGATGGFAADIASATVYERVEVAGALTIAGSATLTATAVGGFVPAPADAFTLIANTSAGGTTGTFAGKPEGAIVPVGGVNKTITYAGGTGNDVVLAQANQPPTVSANLAAVTASEGGPATNTGSFDDPQGRATVTLTASLGSVTQDNTTGLWTWTIPATEGPAGPVNVTITATDDQGATATTTFTYTVTNVAPTLTNLAITPTISENEVATLTGTFTDPGVLDAHTLTVDWDDANAAADSTFAVPATGTLTVGLTLNSTTDSAVLEITSVDTAAGVVGFRVTHQYRDNSASTITVTVDDDDGGLSDLLPLGDAGFETNPVGTLIGSTFTFTSLGVWTIDRGSIRGAENGVVPLAGTRMLRFDEIPPSLTTDIYQLVDVRAFAAASAAGRAQLHLSAFVNAPAAHGFQLTFFSYAEAALPFSVNALEDRSTLPVVTSDADPATWEQLTHSFVIPAGTNFVAVGLSSRRDGSVSYADQVSLRLTVGEQVVVRNVAPAFDAGANEALLSAGVFGRNAIAFTDPGTLDVHTVRVDYDGNGTIDDTINVPLGARAFDLSHGYAAPGTYTVSVTLSDDDGGTLIDTFTVTVNAVPVSEAGGPYAVGEGASVALNGGGSSDANQAAATLTYAWDLDGDGVFAETGPDAVRGDETGVSPTFSAVALNGPSAVTVTLRVTDADGESSLDTATVTINNVAPSVGVTNLGVTVAEATTATNSGTYSDPGLDVVMLSASVGNIVNNGDGTWSWSFATNDGPDQSQTVTVTATDSDGAVSTVTFNLVVTNVAPTVAANDATVTVNEGASVSTSGTFGDVGLDTVALEASLGTIVDNGDGTWNWTFTATDGPDESQTVTITARDHDGAVSTATFALVVNNLAPSVTVLIPAVTVEEGATATNSGTFSDPGLDVVQLSASFGTVVDNGDGTWSWSKPNADGPDDTVLVVITATDGLAQTQTTFQLTVNDIVPVIDPNGSNRVLLGSTFRLNLSDVIDPGTDTVTEYWIHWGDGVTEGFVGDPANATIAYTYRSTAPMTPTIVVDLLDEDGLHLAAGSKTLDVFALPPEAPLDVAVEDSAVTRGSRTAAIVVAAQPAPVLFEPPIDLVDDSPDGDEEPDFEEPQEIFLVSTSVVGDTVESASGGDPPGVGDPPLSPTAPLEPPEPPQALPPPNAAFAGQSFVDGDDSPKNIARILANARPAQVEEIDVPSKGDVTAKESPPPPPEAEEAPFLDAPWKRALAWFGGAATLLLGAVALALHRRRPSPPVAHSTPAKGTTP